jgi:hypothetical protein
MSTRIKINDVVIDWKGTHFQQISAGIKYNKRMNGVNVGSGDIFRSRPLRIYRKEIASSDIEHCNPRISMSIDDINKPGGTITTSALTNRGLATIEDITYSNNKCDHPSANELCSTFLSAENNARRRVRSSGMLRPKFNPNTNNTTYCTTSGQYLASRNRTFDQNKYFHVRLGNDTAKPGSAYSIQNVYSANGLSDCTKCVIPSTSFQYKWIDGINYTVNLSAGSYNIDDLNGALHMTMESNKHFYVVNPSLIHLYLLKFEYDGQSNRIIIKSITTNKYLHSLPIYSLPPVANLISIAWSTGIPTAPLCANPSIVISGYASQVIGFEDGTYPAAQNNTTDISVYGTSVPLLKPTYVPIYYKPNNPQFAVQGAVSSGDLINRKKYDTITSAGASYRSAYGQQTANALAYGSSMYGYTIKDKIGYPAKKTPTFPKYKDSMVACELSKIAHAI